MNALDYLQFVLAPQLFNGLTLGVAVILVALGLTITFGLLDVLNMSHGEFYAVGAFTAVALMAAGLGFWVVLFLAPLLMFPVAMLLERVLIRRVYDHAERHITTLLVTFGLSLVLEDLLKLAFGPNPYRPENPLPGMFEFGGLVLPYYRVFLVCAGSAVIAAIAWLVYRTRLGAMVRAAAFDRHMAASLGVPVGIVFSGTFAFGAALAALAGAILAPVYSVFPTMGHDFIFLAFSVVIVGGMGSVVGAVIAGLLLSQVHALSSLIIAPVWTEAIVFGVMVAFLMLRPKGLYGGLGRA
ncbi:amino acid/amide ABC transporter membrane protein 1, HAAT family [Variovorax sp. HW608]|uniref:branched-chain amino acid ABC transporter permease n=1 Tax=Variovorax sp. HW608 TaxID=1034889 RepID=UPI0008200980|nr:branched-chain amino acid ABC transporter permease [Variovorax sp. HW608]SCK14793.1 amino acid/amide ABC transporter membrane protein 1, HAAT family [Variovorax sp. HW608]